VDKKVARNKWLMAFTLTEMMAVTAIVTSIPVGQYARAKQKALELNCLSNLQQIGKSIVMYQTGTGEYPDAVFYHPEDPLNNERSIAKILENAGAGIPREMWLCPAAPEALRKRGMTFVYNDEFGGRKSLRNPAKAWLLIEVNCVSKKVPAPHPGGYNILFADGHVLTSRVLPPSITTRQQAAIRDLRRRLEQGRLARLLDAVRGHNDDQNPGPLPVSGVDRSLRSGRFQRVGNTGFGKSALPLDAGRARAAGMLAAPVARPGVRKIHTQS